MKTLREDTSSIVVRWRGRNGVFGYRHLWDGKSERVACGVKIAKAYLESREELAIGGLNECRNCIRKISESTGE